MTDSSATTPLQVHYDAMWNNAVGPVASGDIDYDTRVMAGPDSRRGLTLIARPVGVLLQRFDSLLDRLHGAEPQQYRYPSTDMHVTVLPLFTATEQPESQLSRLADYRAAVDDAVAGIAAFEIEFTGITMSRGAVVAQGFPRGLALQTLRNRLRAQLRDRGLDTTLDQRYRLVTAHSTLFRFVAPLQRPERFTELLNSLRDEAFGAMLVDEVELVTNDWYMASRSVDRLAILPLRTPTSA